MHLSTRYSLSLPASGGFQHAGRISVGFQKGSMLPVWEMEASRCSIVGERARSGARAATGTWPSPTVTVPHWHSGWQALMAPTTVAKCTQKLPRPHHRPRHLIAEAEHRRIPGRLGR
jgi:hypothetical protein